MARITGYKTPKYHYSRCTWRRAFPYIHGEISIVHFLCNWLVGVLVKNRVLVANTFNWTPKNARHRSGTKWVDNNRWLCATNLTFKNLLTDVSSTLSLELVGAKLFPCKQRKGCRPFQNQIVWVVFWTNLPFWIYKCSVFLCLLPLYWISKNRSFQCNSIAVNFSWSANFDIVVWCN